MKYILLFLVAIIFSSCNSIERKREYIADFFASGVRAQCQQDLIDRRKHKFFKCEYAYWNTYCFSNIGLPDPTLCDKFKFYKFMREKENE